MNSLMDSKDSLHTLADCFPAGSSVYWGEHADWVFAYMRHRESDTLARSNFDSFLKLLGGEGETVAIERASCSLVGWREYIIVNPADSAKVEIVRKTLENLEGYPVVNEDHWSELEQSEYWEAFLRDSRSEFHRELKEFELQDSTLDRLDTVTDEQIEILASWFENLIPSGEFQTDGYPNFSLAFRDATRDDVARLFRAIHKGEAEERR